jgi:hypothetical protein
MTRLNGDVRGVKLVGKCLRGTETQRKRKKRRMMMIMREERWLKNERRRRNMRRELPGMLQWQAEGDFILQVFNLRKLAESKHSCVLKVSGKQWESILKLLNSS